MTLPEKRVISSWTGSDITGWEVTSLTAEQEASMTQEMLSQVTPAWGQVSGAGLRWTRPLL